MKEPLTRATFTVELAREFFGYDPTLGRAIRIKNGTRGRKAAGQVAGGLHKPSGLYRVKFQGLLVYEHHLIWALVKGTWPCGRLRFVDKDQDNLKIENLCEEANISSEDDRLPSTVDSADLKLSGVVPTKSGKYAAQIYRDGKIHHLGTFESSRLASQAYFEAKKVLHSPLNRELDTQSLLNKILSP